MGPLKGFKIIEIAGIGPGQLAGMLLADMGASLVRIERPYNTDTGVDLDPRFNIMNRSRPIIGVDLKHKRAPSWYWVCAKTPMPFLKVTARVLWSVLDWGRKIACGGTRSWCTGE